MVLSGSHDVPALQVVPLSLKQHILAGGLSRGAAVTSMFPIDTLKTRLQMGQPSLSAVIKPPYFPGYNAAIFSQIPYGMAVFGTYEGTKGLLLDRFPQGNKTVIFFLAAVLGDVVGSTVLTPGEMVKQQVQAGLHKDVLAAVVNTYRAKGVGGFYQGYTSLIARDVPFRAIQLPLYEVLKTTYANRRCGGNIEDIGPPQAALLGATAGMVGAGLTNPIDVIKTRMMTGSGGTSLGQAIAEISKTNPLGFLAGLPQRVGFLGGSSAVFFITYEFVRGTIQGGITIDMDMLG